MENREEFVKNELFKFVQNHSPGGIEDFHSSVDEIVLSYMVSILEVLGSESSTEDEFDVESFTEMMDAYLPGFSQINSIQTAEWMFHLSCKLLNHDSDNNTATTDSEGNKECNVEEILSKPSKLCVESKIQSDCTENQSNSSKAMPAVCRSRTNSSRTSSTSETPSSNGARTTSSRQSSLSESDIQNVNGETVGGNESDECIENDEQVKFLLEMFPAACTMEVAHCMCVANGNIEGAAQLMLHRQETGETVTQQSKSQSKKSRRKKGDTPIIGDKDVKKDIIQRYSYVDTEEDKKEHKPIGPKNQPKKMVRYLDGRVVSTRGDRFTEIKKDEGEDMKKTYVNLKPARQYRFH